MRAGRERWRICAAHWRLVALALVVECADHAIAASTLSDTRSRGRLLCGLVSEAEDWNKEDVHGDLSALGAEICRAVAVATLGRDTMERRTYPAEPEALAGLAHGDVDLVVGVTPTARRARRYGLTFGPAIFLDPLTVMTQRGAASLAGRTVCFIDGTDAAATLLATVFAPFFATPRAGGAARPFPFQEEGEMASALSGGRCDAAAGYASRLATMRARLPAPPSDLALLPGRLAIEPASIATRDGDAAWSLIVASTVRVLFGAEMAEVDRAGAGAGLAPGWPRRVLAAIGSYDHLFDRTAGAASPLGLTRGPNPTCLEGGALCAAPVR